MSEVDPKDGSVRDQVDRLVAAWRRARPTAFAEHALEPWEFDVLTALRRAGAPYQLSPGQLLTQTLVTSGTMTNRIDRLAGKGLVQRLPDPDDRRGVLVRLTKGGQERADAALSGLLDHERAILAELSTTQRDDLAALLRQLVAPFDNLTDQGT